MERAEAGKASKAKIVKPDEGRRWADVHHYAYSAALTDIIDQCSSRRTMRKKLSARRVRRGCRFLNFHPCN